MLYSKCYCMIPSLTHNTGITAPNELLKLSLTFELHRGWACLLLQVANNSICWIKEETKTLTSDEETTYDITQNTRTYLLSWDRRSHQNPLRL